MRTWLIEILLVLIVIGLWGDHILYALQSVSVFAYSALASIERGHIELLAGLVLLSLGLSVFNRKQTHDR